LSVWLVACSYWDPDDPKIPEEIRKRKPVSSRSGGDDTMHLVQFYDPTSSWYVFRYDQSDLLILDAISHRTWVSTGSLLLSEDDGRYWECFASVMSDSFIRPRRFSTCAKFEAPTMENKQY